MDLFPDEAHVRLRNRVHATYLHADEDGAGVSLRPHGRVPSRNAVWRVHRVPLQGTGYLLLQGAAYGWYLAVSPDLAPPGYGGRRAIQRDYDADSHAVEPPEDVAWRPVRVDDEGDAVYVLLRNFDRSLRANGKHRIWHTGVTVASNDDSSTPMMHWTVEVVVPLPAPSSSLPEKEKAGFAYLPANKGKIDRIDTRLAQLEKDSLSSQTKLSGQECGCDDSVLMGSDVRKIASSASDIKFPRLCLGCSKESSSCLCEKCTRRMNIALLKAKEASLRTGNFSFCLKCSALAQGDHASGAHNGDCIPLHTLDGSQVAWVTKKERWCAIFAGIQSDRHWNKLLGRPFLLHKPQGRRCEVCADHLSDDKLYGTLIRFCSIECWAYKAEAAVEFGWLRALIQADFNRTGEHYYFCSICRCVFSGCEDDADNLRDQEHDADHLHDDEVEALRVVTEFVGGTTAIKIEVPVDHFMIPYWKCIKDLAGGEILSSPNHLFLLRDDGADRCKTCKLRLEDGGGQTCSLECSLRDTKMLPRQVQIQLKELSKPQGAQELCTQIFDAA